MLFSFSEASLLAHQRPLLYPRGGLPFAMSNQLPFSEYYLLLFPVHLGKCWITTHPSDKLTHIGRNKARCCKRRPYGKRKPMRREVFFQVMDHVIPWDLLIKTIVPYYPKAGPQGGRPAYPIEVMLRIYFLQNWYGYADWSMEEALYENEVLHRFAKVSIERIADATSLLHFRHLLERYGLCSKLFESVHLDWKGLWLKEGSIVDATIIHAPTSTKNRNRQRDPEM